MSIASHLDRIFAAKNKIRAKLVHLGLTTSNASIDECADAVDGIRENGNVSIQLREGETYNIPAGMHPGSGTVSAVAGGGNYTLQSKTFTPSKVQQQAGPDEGYYGLSDVTVLAIPSNYNDTTPVTATADDVVANKIIVGPTGNLITGNIPIIGAVEKVLDVSTTVANLAKGLHNGLGKVRIILESKTITPTKKAQTVKPAPGKVLSEVLVNPIPAEFQNVSGVTATATDILTGKNAVAADGSLLEGAMPSNGPISLTFDGLTATSVEIPAGHTTGGTVSLTDDIERRLAEI